MQSGCARACSVCAREASRRTSCSPCTSAPGKVAGLTELVVPAQHPTRADQYDTIIVPEHNGYGLPRALKARMLLELRTAEPQLREVQTWHAAENEQLQQVN